MDNSPRGSLPDFDDSPVKKESQLGKRPREEMQ